MKQIVKKIINKIVNIKNSSYVLALLTIFALISILGIAGIYAPVYFKKSIGIITGSFVDIGCVISLSFLYKNWSLLIKTIDKIAFISLFGNFLTLIMYFSWQFFNYGTIDEWWSATGFNIAEMGLITSNILLLYKYFLLTKENLELKMKNKINENLKIIDESSES